jgi:DNA-binding transcriptional LysR family regulator
VLLQLRSFLAVVQKGSLHQAAIGLNISQSALSRQMQALEHEVGGKLLERSSTGVVPTRGGRELASRMGSWLADYDMNLLAVRRAIRGETGELRIGYLASAFAEHLEPALEQLRRHHPDTKVKLLDLFPGEQSTELRQGKLDLAFTDDEREFPKRDFQAKKIAVTRSIVCLPAEHPLASRKHLKISQLKDETFIVSPDSLVPSVRRHLMRVCRTFGKFRPKTVELAGGLSEAFSAIANDGAAAIMPDFLRHQKRPGVVFVPISDAGTSGLFVVWQRGHGSKPLRTLLAAFPSVE